jgi:hypothetical protein
MSAHQLLTVKDHEVTWFQRRRYLQAAVAWVAAGGAATVLAQSRSNIVQLEGDAILNGARLRADMFIQTGDQVSTGPNSSLVFVVGNASFLMRQNTQMTVERGSSLGLVSVLRLVTGAVASVFGTGQNRRIYTPTMTAGIRGTGVYTEVFPAAGNRTYFCNCYGQVELIAGDDRSLSQASYHQSFWAEPVPKAGRLLTPAKAINHTDEELEALAALVKQTTQWQRMGKRGSKDGMGYLEGETVQTHPAMLLGR